GLAHAPPGVYERRRHDRRPRQQVERKLEEILAGCVAMSEGVVEGGGGVDAGEASHDVVPEERPESVRAVLAARDRENPRADDQPLEREACIQLPAAQLRPAPLPHDESEE